MFGLTIAGDNLCRSCVKKWTGKTQQKETGILILHEMNLTEEQLVKIDGRLLEKLSNPGMKVESEIDVLVEVEDSDVLKNGMIAGHEDFTIQKSYEFLNLIHLRLRIQKLSSLFNCFQIKYIYDAEGDIRITHDHE